MIQNIGLSPELKPVRLRLTQVLQICQESRVMTQHYLTSVINTSFVKLNQNTVDIKVSLKKESLQNYKAVNFFLLIIVENF